MKKIIISFLILLFLCSCSSQTKVNPEIFVERLISAYPEINIKKENCYYVENCFFTFISYKSVDNIALKADLTENQSIKKVSVSAVNCGEILDIICSIINIYSYDEENNEIINKIINNSESFRYVHGKRHTYSFIQTDKNIYFEIINNRLYDYSVPDLTLKPNDKTQF